MTLPCNNEAKVRTFRRLFTSLDATRSFSKMHRHGRAMASHFAMAM